MVRLIAFASLLALGIVVGTAVFRKDEPQARFHDGRLIPPDGLVFNPKARVPFEPREIEQDFKCLYEALVGFRQLHGRLPTIAELRDFSKPICPGIRLGNSDFQTPDALNADYYADSSPERNDYGLAYGNPRPDGSPRPAFPSLGQRDVWIAGSACARWDQRIFQDGHSETTHFGYHILLWSDGSIERVPERDTLWIRSPDGGMQREFPGQAGLPRQTWPRPELDRLQGYGKFNRVAYE